MGLCLNASKAVSRLVEATINRGSSESREAPDKVICLPRTAYHPPEGWAVRRGPTFAERCTMGRQQDSVPG